MLVADTGLSPARAYALATKDRAEQIRLFFNEEFRKPIEYTGEFGGGIGQSPEYYIGSYGIADSQENMKLVFSICSYRDICTVIENMDIDGKYFSVVTEVKLVSQYADNDIFDDGNKFNSPPSIDRDKLDEQKLQEKLAHLKRIAENFMQ